MYSLRGGFLIRPLTIALALGCAGALLSWLEETYPAVSAWVPTILFPSHADPQVAQVILAGIATSIMTVVSIVFAILLMTLTLASMQFSPRIIVSFSRDRVTQWTLGIFLGTFSYCMAALPAARSFPHPFAPVATVLGAMVLALACVGLLLFFIHHISEAISVNHIVDRIAEETEAMIDEIMPWPYRPTRMKDAAPLRPNPSEVAVLSGASGYIRFVDKRRLVAVAKHYHVSIRVLRRVGHFVPAGIPLMMISKGDRLLPEGTSELPCLALSRSAPGRPLRPGGNPADDDLKGGPSAPRRNLRTACRLRLRPDQNVAAGCGVWRPADCRCGVEGDLARRQRPHHRYHLRRSVEPHSDPLRVPRAARGSALRSAGHRSRQHCMDPFRAPTRGCL